MCRVLVFCLMLAFIPLGMAAPASAYGNGTLLNGGFESATGSGITIFDGWKIDSTGAKATNGSPAGSTYARTGNNALKISAGSGSQKTPAQQLVSVIPGQTYDASYYINVATCNAACVSGGSAAGMTIRFYDNKANPDNFSTTGATQVGNDMNVGGITGTVTSGYTQIQKSFTVPANAEYMRVYVFSISATSGSMIAYVDDISIVQTAGSTPIAATGVSLNKASTTIEKAGTETLVATVSPAGAPQAVKWTSSNTNVATVDVNSGLVTAVNTGTATITATSTTVTPPSATNAVYTASAQVSVVAGMPVPVYGLTLTPSFSSISVYIAGGRDDLIRHLYYKKSADTVWKEALEPITIPDKGIFSGSIVRLDEDTSYDVKSDIYFGSTLIKSETGTVRTWTSTPTIAQTISLSSLYTSGGLTINGITGTNNGWVKVVNDTGLTIDAGFATDHAVAVTNSVYTILEGFIVKGGKKNGIYLNNTNHDVRISNSDISGWGRVAVDTVHTQQQLDFINKSDVGYGTPIDDQGNTLEGDAGFRIEDAKNIVVERSYVHEPRGYANPWTGITSDGQVFSNSHPQGPEAMYLRSAGGIVVRYNDFSGTDEYHRFNDVISGYYNSQESGGFYKDADIYGNFFGYSNDDSVEFDGGQSNIRVFDNRVEMSYAGLSFAPNMVGPSYAFNNVLYNMNDFRRTGTGSVIKLGGNSSTTYDGETWFFNNTIYAVPKAIVGSSTPKGWYGGTKNNLIVVMRNFTSGTSSYYNIEDNPLINPGTNFDYDALGRTTAADGAGQILANAGAEAHGLFKIGKMTNPGAGVFTPTASGVDTAREVNVIDKGTVVKNFAETYSGSAPDIGAFEVGGSSLFPKRPIPFQSDKYLIAIPATDNTATFTISTGALTSSGNYSIRRNAEEDWYTVTPVSGTFASNSQVTFTIQVDRTKASFNRAAEYSTLFIRLANGFSVPITIKADNSVTTVPVGQTVQINSTKAFPNTSNLSADWKSSSAAAPITSTTISDVTSVQVTGAYAGSATITANSSVNGVNQAEYRVVVPSKLSDIQVNGQSVVGFGADTFTYNVALPAGTAVPTITGISQDAGSAVPSTVTYSLPASLPGTAVVKTTSADGTTSNTYTIQFTVASSISIAGYWNLDETSGTVASDSSGNHLNGTLINGPVWTTGKIGNSLDFDGVNDEIDLGTPTALQFTGAVSAAAWIYVDSFSGDGRIISKEYGANSRSWSLNVKSGGKGVFQIATGSNSSITVETASTLPVGQWVHLAGVYEPGVALRLYVNGILSNSNLSSIPSTQYNNTSHVFIGRRPDFSNAFNGKIDEVYVFGNALTGTDIAALAGN
ncbi:LamG-like jellyroll fold domain-containing protein [Paenibacillus oryzisoli]|uniref:LamG-like jellyroll fold domain-containing protein n=1 Tax=Paenibacillus oryzisoli TaxID=1850517 RepID=UPI00195D83D2|nr:LamG-like jellyroll fold domain-containing protein [Paenibacillus oryzisoli]